MAPRPRSRSRARRTNARSTLLDQSVHLTGVAATDIGGTIVGHSAQAAAQLGADIITDPISGIQSEAIYRYLQRNLRPGEHLETALAAEVQRRYEAAYYDNPAARAVHRCLTFGPLGVSLGQLCTSGPLAAIAFSPLGLANALANTGYFMVTYLQGDMLVHPDLRARLPNRDVMPPPGLYFRPRLGPTPRVEYPGGLVAGGGRPFQEVVTQGFADVTPSVTIRGRSWVLDPMLQLYVAAGTGPASQEVLYFWGRSGYREAFCFRDWQSELMYFLDYEAPGLTDDMVPQDRTDIWQWISSSAPAAGYPPNTQEILREAARAMDFADERPLTALAGFTPGMRSISAILIGPRPHMLARFANAVQLWLRGFLFARHNKYGHARRCVHLPYSPEAEDSWRAMLRLYPHLAMVPLDRMGGQPPAQAVPTPAPPVAPDDQAQTVPAPVPPAAPDHQAEATPTYAAPTFSPASPSPEAVHTPEEGAARGSADAAEHPPGENEGTDTSEESIPPPPPGGRSAATWDGDNFYRGEPAPGEPDFAPCKPVPLGQRPGADPFTTTDEPHYEPVWTGGDVQEPRRRPGAHECPSAWQLPNRACMMARALRGKEIQYQNTCKLFNLGALDHHPDGSVFGVRCANDHRCCICSGDHAAWKCGARAYHLEYRQGHYGDFAPPPRRHDRESRARSRGSARGRDRSRHPRR